MNASPGPRNTCADGESVALAVAAAGLTLFLLAAGALLSAPPAHADAPPFGERAPLPVPERAAAAEPQGAGDAGSLTKSLVKGAKRALQAAELILDADEPTAPFDAAQASELFGLVLAGSASQPPRASLRDAPARSPSVPPGASLRDAPAVAGR